MRKNLNVNFEICNETQKAVFVDCDDTYVGWIPKSVCAIKNGFVVGVQKWFARNNGFYEPTEEEIEAERIEREEIEEMRMWNYASMLGHYESFGDRL